MRLDRAQEARGRSTWRGGPLLRAQLLRLAEDEHVLLLTLHHIVCDGWSLGVLVRELAALYAASLRGRAVAAAGAAGAVRRLRGLAARVAGGEASAWSAQLGYWRERLAGAPAARAADRPAAAGGAELRGRARLRLASAAPSCTRPAGAGAAARERRSFMALLAGVRRRCSAR